MKLTFTTKKYTLNRIFHIKSHFDALSYQTKIVDINDSLSILDSDIWFYDFHCPELNDDLESIRDILFKFKGKFILLNLDDYGAIYLNRIKQDIIDRIDAIVTGARHKRGTDYAIESVYNKIVLFPRFIIPRVNLEHSNKENKIFFAGQLTNKIRYDIIKLLKEKKPNLFYGGITGNPQNENVNYEDVSFDGLNLYNYYNILNKYKIGICPPGNVWWTYRHIDNMACKNLVLTTPCNDVYDWLYKEKVQNEFIYFNQDLSNLEEMVDRTINGEFDNKIEPIYNIYKNFFEINENGSFKFSVWSEIKDKFDELGIHFKDNEHKIINKYGDWWGEPAHQERGGWWGEGHDVFFKELISENNVKTICEVGTYMGKSTCAFARMLPEDGKITTVDTFKGSPEFFALKIYNQINELYMTASKNLRLDAHSKKIKMINKSSLDFNTNEKFDLIYLDGHHGEEEVIQDIKHYIKFVKPGGILSGDDMMWPSVKKAVERCIEDKTIPPLNGLFRDVIWWVKL